MKETFFYRGHELHYLLSGYNCYHAHVSLYTERIVEIPVADYWLSQLETEPIVEVGAVTPYYWPGRIKEIVDPYDSHPNVTIKKRVQDVFLDNKNFLSISTLEHLGKGGEYGQNNNPHLACDTLLRLVFASQRMLATWPTGYNEQLDTFALKLKHPGVYLTCLVREANGWVETEPQVRPYGTFGNAIFIIEKENVANTIV